jgi:hypothetical protein
MISVKRIWGTLVVAGFLALGLISGCGSEKQAAQAEAGATQRPAATQETAQGTAQEPGTLTLAYTYQPKSGAWANQLAAWIEDENGTVVRTLMATRFTAQGGYKKRSMSLPVWVKRSGLAQMDSNQVDALTSATPQAGKQTLVWDGKDDKGQPVPDGTYKVVLEATLYKNSDELFIGTFVKGGPDQPVKIDAVLDQEPEQAANRDMVSGVNAVYKRR